MFRIQPAALVASLSDACARHGVRVFGDSAVLDVTVERGGESTVFTRGGRVTCGSVLWALNGYGPAQHRGLAACMVAARLAVVLTGPVANAPNVHVREVQRMSRTLGTTPEGRVFLRGVLPHLGEDGVGAMNKRDVQGLMDALCARLPWVRGAALDLAWLAPCAETRTHGPVVGVLTNGHHVAGGFGGAGLVAGHQYGTLVAHRMAGVPHPDERFLRGPGGAAWIPPDPWRTWVVGFMHRWLAWDAA